MLSFLAIIFIGWPGIIASMVFSLAGVTTKRPGLILLGAVLAVPFSLYLAMTPLFRGWGLVFPLFIAGASLAVRKKALGLSWLLLLPYSALLIWTDISVLTQ